MPAAAFPVEPRAEQRMKEALDGILARRVERPHADVVRVERIEVPSVDLLRGGAWPEFAAGRRGFRRSALAGCGERFEAREGGGELTGPGPGCL